MPDGIVASAAKSLGIEALDSIKVNFLKIPYIVGHFCGVFLFKNESK